MEKEIWKEHLLGYRVSSLGKIIGKRGGRGFKNSEGYLMVKLWKKSYSVHSIIWEAFNGPVPKGLEINHIDLDKTNNALSNLELLTHKENVQHAYRVGNFEKNRGEKNPRAKLTSQQVREIRSLFNQGNHKQVRLAELFKVSYRSISLIVNNKTWPNV